MAAVSCGKCRRLRKTHPSDAAICGKIEKILISKKKFAVSCGRLNEPLAYLAYAEIMYSDLVKNSHVACNISKFVYYISYCSQSHKVTSGYKAVMPCC